MAIEPNSPTSVAEAPPPILVLDGIPSGDESFQHDEVSLANTAPIDDVSVLKNISKNQNQDWQDKAVEDCLGCSMIPEELVERVLCKADKTLYTCEMTDWMEEVTGMNLCTAMCGDGTNKNHSLLLNSTANSPAKDDDATNSTTEQTQTDSLLDSLMDRDENASIDSIVDNDAREEEPPAAGAPEEEWVAFQEGNDCNEAKDDSEPVAQEATSKNVSNSFLSILAGGSRKKKTQDKTQDEEDEAKEEPTTISNEENQNNDSSQPEDVDTSGDVEVDVDEYMESKRSEDNDETSQPDVAGVDEEVDVDIYQVERKSSSFLRKLKASNQKKVEPTSQEDDEEAQEDDIIVPNSDEEKTEDPQADEEKPELDAATATAAATAVAAAVVTAVPTSETNEEDQDDNKNEDADDMDLQKATEETDPDTSHDGDQTEDGVELCLPGSMPTNHMLVAASPPRVKSKKMTARLGRLSKKIFKRSSRRGSF